MADFRLTDWGQYKTSWIESDRIQDCMDYYLAENLDGIGLSNIHGYKLKDIRFLKNFPFLKGLVITEPNVIDITGIEDLRHLKYVSISGNKQPVDYSVFPELEQIRNDWHPKMKITEDCKKLNHLYLGKYKSKTKDISQLPFLESLEFLGIVQSTMASTKGVGKYDKLRCLEFHYLTKLETLCDMDALQLKSLTFGNCKKIQNHEYVKCMKTLEVLRLNDCGEMSSIGFINEMSQLKDFRFVGTNVVDGDISPCLKLEGVGFTSKKHFSQTLEQMRKLLDSK